MQHSEDQGLKTIRSTVYASLPQMSKASFLPIHFFPVSFW